MKISVNKKNVHSDIVFKEIDKFVQSQIIMFSLQNVSCLLEYFMIAMSDQYKLDQVNIIADERNNIIEDQKTGKYNIDIYYKHNNCFNVTQLYYTFQR